MGALAAVELGPGALNLMGAKVGAQLVANELTPLIWSTPTTFTAEKGGKRKLQNNSFAMLGGSDDDSSSDDDEGGGACARIL